MFRGRKAAARPEFSRVSRVSGVQGGSACLFGKLPRDAGCIHYGLHEEPERVFRSWLEHAVQMACSVLPNRAVRFIVAPRRTPMIGVWVPSRDAFGQAFPLVFLRRLACSASVGPDLPWTLLLAGYAQHLAAAESCLMLGRSEVAAAVWRKLEALHAPGPHGHAMVALCTEAKRRFAVESPATFAKRTLGERAPERQLASALRRLRTPLEDTRTSAHASPCEYATLALPADAEFDLFAWLELLRAQRAPDETPSALFWSPADRRAFISLGTPAPTTLAFLRQPRAHDVQRLPLSDEPDECPALDRELQSVIGRCTTLAQLRAAVSGEASWDPQPSGVRARAPEIVAARVAPAAAPRERKTIPLALVERDRLDLDARDRCCIPPPAPPCGVGCERLPQDAAAFMPPPLRSRRRDAETSKRPTTCA